MVTNEKLVDFVERLENRILVLETRIKSMEIHNIFPNEMINFLAYDLCEKKIRCVLSKF